MNFQHSKQTHSQNCLRYLFLIICLCIQSELFAVPKSPNSELLSRPNVIIVFIDDMGWSDLSCFDGEQIETEHLDRLASEGVRFTNFYVNSPICSPSRVALATGQYPQRWRITSYLNNRTIES